MLFLTIRTHRFYNTLNSVIWKFPEEKNNNEHEERVFVKDFHCNTAAQVGFHLVCMCEGGRDFAVKI